MGHGFASYIKAAFNARPLGMPIPPNWIGLAAIALGGVVEPGVWIVGAGVELAYLLYLASNKRFQRAVDGIADRDAGQAHRLDALVRSLHPEEMRRYQHLTGRCREILEQQKSHGADVAVQAEALSRLALVYLQLLVSRKNLTRLLSEDDSAELPDRIREVERQLERKTLSPELRNSLEGQLAILQQRLAGRQEAAGKLQFVSAELVRIEEQVELVREQAVISSDAGLLAERIDAITGSLSQTNQWMREQQKIIGRMEDIGMAAPSLLEPPDQLKA